MQSLFAHLVSNRGSASPPLHDLIALLASRPEEFAVLHSASGHGPTVIGWRPVVTIELTSARKLRIANPRELPIPEIPADLSPLEAFEHLRNGIELSIDGDLHAGWLGYFAYDIAQIIETLPRRAPDDMHLPLFRWSLFDCYIICAGGTCTIHAWDWNTDNPTIAIDRLIEMRSILEQVRASAPALPETTLIESTPRGEFVETIARAKEYIAAGDVYQVNLAQRWSAHTSATPAAIYRRLCEETPAAYSALLKFDGGAIISASPELLLDMRGRHLTTRPIKGTRPRDPANPAHDAALAADLLHSEKEKAELAMIVDLLRNDLGRVAEFGSVAVTHARTLEKLPTVWHTVAQINATCRNDCSIAGIIAALCPGGSVTGAPKIRAMEIIDELESHRRGVYCGSIGFISPTHATLNIAIRTIQMIDGTAHIWAGGGIVADSVPELEYEETLHKAAAMFRALNLAI